MGDGEGKATGMRTFTGFVQNISEGKLCYHVNLSGRYHDPHCTGYADELRTGDRYTHWDGEGPAWGYEGGGPDKISIMLLARTLDPRWPYEIGLRLDGSTHSKRPIILKLYKQFTSEIVSNFEDRWSITDEEILAWVKEKESQHAVKT